MTRGYTTECFILDGPINDILSWRYSRLPDLLGAGRGFAVETASQLQEALQQAIAKPSKQRPSGFIANDLTAAGSGRSLLPPDPRPL